MLATIYRTKMHRRTFLSSTAGAATVAALPVLLKAGTITADQEIGADRDLTGLIERLDVTIAHRLVLGAGEYRIRASTEIGNLQIEGAGRDRTALSVYGRGSGYALTSNGSHSPLAQIRRLPRFSSKALELAGPARVRTGDLVQVFSPASGGFSTIRNLYREGGFARVARSEGALIWLEGDLPEGLEQLALLARKVVPTRPRISNLAIRSGSRGAFHARHTAGCELNDVTVECAAPIGIYLDRSCDFLVLETRIRNAGSGSGSDYGLAIGNCQDGRVGGGDYRGRRHGISLGGGDFPDSMPNRRITVADAFIANDSGSAVHASDMHGNCENVVFRGCKIRGGASLAGRNNAYVGCHVTAMANGVCMVGTEILGGTLTLERCTLISGADASLGYRGIIDFGGNSKAISEHMRSPLDIIVRDCLVEGRNQSSSSRIVELRNRGTHAPIDIAITGLSFDMDAIGAVLSMRNHAGTGWKGTVNVSAVRGNRAARRISTG